MPVIKSAKKKLRKDIKREKRNDQARASLKKSLKLAKKNPTQKNISAAMKSLDLAAKKNLIHKNKAARLKSKLAKQISTENKPAKVVKSQKTTTAKTTKKSSK